MSYSDKFESDNKKRSKNIGLSTTGANYNISSDNLTKNERLMNGVADWASFYRENPHIFVEEFLGIRLKPFQKIVLFSMIHYNNTMFLASRGLSKTFLTAIYCVVRAILYPGSKIIVASGVKSQAMKIVSEKIPEMISMSKTGMIEREIKGSIKTGMNGDDPNVVFHNGSWIKVVPASHNARSSRATILVLDEFRMVKPEIYTSVLRRFLTVSRQPGFLSKKEYATQEYQERNQEIFLTSCYYKYNWSYARYKVFLNAMLQGKGYFVCGLPYQIGIKENLSNKAQLLEEMNEDDFDEVLWDMEMNCKFFGESTKAYYKYEELSKCRTIQKPIIPISDEQFASFKGSNSKLSFFRPKQQNEIRILAVDVALIGGKKNDASQMMLINMIPQGVDSYTKMVEYMESADGGNTELQAFRIKQLFYDLNCDYCVLDTMGNGIGLYDIMTKSTIDEIRDRVYPAWCSMNDETKDMTRSIEKDAIPVIYTVTTSGQNAGATLHEMYTYAKLQFERRKLRLMINELEGKEFMIENHDFLKKDSYEQATMIAPYMQASRLITELTQLESEIRAGFIKLVEPPGKRKDRAMCLFYGMYYIKILEADLKKRSQKNSYEDLYNGATSVQKKKVHPFMGGSGNPFAQNRANPFERRR